MNVELFHLVTGGAQVFTRVKLTGLVVEDLADGGGHGKTAVGVDVDLADGALGGFAELLLRDTYCIREFTAKLVDDVHILLRNGAGTMENDGEAGELLLNLMENVKCQGRRYQLSGLGVTGALLRGELVCAVAGADGDCQGVAACAGCKVDDFLGLGVVGFRCGNLILNACEDTEFCLYGDIVLVSIFNNLLGEGDVFLVRKGRRSSTSVIISQIFLLNRSHFAVGS